MQHTVEERLSFVESAAFLAERDMSNMTTRMTHLTTGIDTVSGDLRALSHEVHTEILPRLDRIEERLDSMDRRLGGVEAGVAALLAHFNITPPEVAS